MPSLMRALPFIIAVFVLSFSTLDAQAQKEDPIRRAQQKEISDPQAKKILDKMKAKFESYKTIQATFKLTIETGSEKDVQQGTTFLAGNKYRMEMSKQDVICDGQAVWFHAKKDNEVQVSDANTEEGSMLSPSKLLMVYQEGKKVLYAISGEGTENGKHVVFIEFKPTNNQEDYSKMRVAIDKTTDQVVQVKIFGKDGMRYTFDILSLTPNAAIPASKFIFDKSKFPGIHVVDNR